MLTRHCGIIGGSARDADRTLCHTVDCGRSSIHHKVSKYHWMNEWINNQCTNEGMKCKFLHYEFRYLIETEHSFFLHSYDAMIFFGKILKTEKVIKKTQMIGFLQPTAARSRFYVCLNSPLAFLLTFLSPDWPTFLSIYLIPCNVSTLLYLCIICTAGVYGAQPWKPVQRDAQLYSSISKIMPAI